MLAGLFLLAIPHRAVAADLRQGIIYQIVIDRFADGDPANNNPPQSPGLFDPSHTNWRLYWGGDLQGIRSKMDYLAGLGVTAIWISPPVDNVNVGVPDAKGQMSASYHGYQARDYKRIEEHFGDTANSWAAFDNLVAAAHEKNIQVIVDFTPNHSNFNNAGDYGAIYDDGRFLGNYPNDANGYYHHEPNITNRYGRFQVQYETLYDLADINQLNPAMDEYLKAAARRFQEHGADGFRIDGVKHVTWGWQYSFANSVYSSGDSFIFGEWYLEDPPVQGAMRRFFAYLRATFSRSGTSINTADPLYHDAYKFANKSGISLLDFPLNTAIRHVFGPTDANFSEIDSTLEREARDFNWTGDAVTFIDNQDMARLLSLSDNRHRLHEALAFLLTARGLPCIYYGTEQYLHDDTNGGTDPYNRPMMNEFSPETVAYSLIAQLSSLRRLNPALAYGSMTQSWLDRDVYIYERRFAGNVLLVAINKNETESYEIGGLRTMLPPATYTDYLGQKLGGLTINVASCPFGENRVGCFELPPHSVSVWSYVDKSGGPQLGSIGPTIAQPGVTVTLAGINFGSSSGRVMFGETAASVVSWNETSIKAIVPPVVNGKYNLRVINSSEQNSNSLPFTVLTGKLIPVTFKVNNAPPTQPGEQLFLTGNTIELGNWKTTWDEAVGPLTSGSNVPWSICAAVPAGQPLQFKFVRLAADGSVTWEAGANHEYTPPASGVGEVEVNWQY